MTRRDAFELLTGAAASAASPPRVAAPTPIGAFKIPVDRQAAFDLRHRLRTARWPDAIINDWTLGTPPQFLENFIGYWADSYDWETRVADLNVLPHYRGSVAGFGIHYLHFRSQKRQAIPLLLMNGWPSSFVEYLRLAPLLTDGSPAFHLVLPTLPGFGYSDRPTRLYQVEPADLYPTLMQRLGYDRFLVAGTDIGAEVATRIALRCPNLVIGAHIGDVTERTPRKGDPPPSAQEIAYHKRDLAWDRDEGGYCAIQSSKPQTLAYGLTDSPVGLAAWILEKFRGWSDSSGDPLSVFPLQMLADNLTIYWMTNTISSSIRSYYDSARLRPPLGMNDFVRVPTAVGMWPKGLGIAPPELARRLYNVQRYTVFPSGGHFAAWEEPQLYASDLRAFAAALTS
ncbi:MAG TPA: epoxide hydrolase [Sphingomicrobium sp.]|nr:epoxide hydrolase [Sphingomicrobium sp.]